jgi:hypothetical protein
MIKMCSLFDPVVKIQFVYGGKVEPIHTSIKFGINKGSTWRMTLWALNSLQITNA